MGSFLSHPATAGGLASADVHYPDCIQSQRDNLPTLDLHDQQAARRYFERTRRSILKSNNRKLVPEWDAPSEVWKVLLHPRTVHRIGRHGIGFDDTLPDMHAFHARLDDIHMRARSTNTSPLHFMLSNGISLNKGNGEQDYPSSDLYTV